jgi:hypothetical protein
MFEVESAAKHIQAPKPYLTVKDAFQKHGVVVSPGDTVNVTNGSTDDYIQYQVG